MRRSDLIILATFVVPVIALAQTAPGVKPSDTSRFTAMTSATNAAGRNAQRSGTVQVLTPNSDEAAALKAAKLKSAGLQATLNVYRKRHNLPSLNMEPVNRTLVPVLVVPVPALYSTFQIISTRDHYILSGSDDLNGIVLTGTRVAVMLPKMGPVPPLDERSRYVLSQALSASGASDPITDVSVTTTEDGAEASFRRYGALYDLRLNCAKRNAPECSTETALKLIAGAAVLGGGQ